MLFSRTNLIIMVCMAAGLTVLCSLGFWQVNRLYWKEDLIARVEARTSQEAVNLVAMMVQKPTSETHEYTPVKASGTFDHSGEVYYLSTSKQGKSGWNIHTPLVLENGQSVLVNRGFVNFDMKDPSKREAGQVTGVQIVEGLLRFPVIEKPFGPDNNLEKREFYWRNLSEMVEASGGDMADFLPVILDADSSPNPGGFPVGGTTIISFSNNHLQYAVTWFGLALTLLGVGSVFIFRNMREGNG